MYRLTCDGLPLLDIRFDDYVLVNPKISLEVNKVGEGSFTIYKNHPYYDSLKKLKSVFEVSDDHGVIFRGRATGDTVDFDHGKHVDLEGAMAYFNDSVVRPFNFPDDFLEDEEYITAEANGERVAFFLGWLIEKHNARVQDFQKMKLGNVTVRDPDFTRSNSEYASTWEVLKGKLIDSSLGGYLCIRYEADGNYIDYLSTFTETNSQEIMFGENLLDLKKETEASAIYSAVIPIGAAGLTIEGLGDANITDDIVKTGDTLYSRKAVAEYGWIYAPTSETTWDEVVYDADLLARGVEWLAIGGIPLDALEATAVDLHFTDKQIESLRIYKKVNVRSVPHGVKHSFLLSRLEIDLLNPQNTKVKVGETISTLTVKTSLQQEETKKQYSKLSKTDEQILLEVKGVNDKYTELAITIDGVTVSDEDGTTWIKGSSIETDTLYVKAANVDGTLTANQIKLGGAMSVYKTARGSVRGGYLGYIEGMDYEGNTTQGIGLLTDSGMVVATSGGAKLSTAYGQVVVTDNINLETDNNIWLTGTNIYSSVAISDVSDRNKKDSIQYDVDKYLPVFDGLIPATFYYKDHNCGKRHLGFIAQDVENAMETAGIKHEEFAPLDIRDDGSYGLRYTEFIPLLVAKIKQLDAEVQKLKAKLQDV